MLQADYRYLYAASNDPAEHVKGADKGCPLGTIYSIPDDEYQKVREAQASSWTSCSPYAVVAERGGWSPTCPWVFDPDLGQWPVPSRTEYLSRRTGVLGRGQYFPPVRRQSRIPLESSLHQVVGKRFLMLRPPALHIIEHLQAFASDRFVDPPP